MRKRYDAAFKAKVVLEFILHPFVHVYFAINKPGFP